MDWVSENKDLFALAISVMALIASMVSTALTVRANRRSVQLQIDANQDAAVAQREHSTTLERARTFQRMHEMMIDPKAARGRRLLYKAYAAGHYPKLGEQGWDEINYSLSLYDTLGAYLSRGEVAEAAVLDTWHHPLRSIKAPIEAFAEHRRRNKIYEPWQFLPSLLARATTYECRCGRPETSARVLGAAGGEHGRPDAGGRLTRARDGGVNP